MNFFECLHPWCAADKLGELWCVEYYVIEEGYSQVMESRCIDVGHEVVQVLVDPFEPKKFKSWEDSACLWRQTSACVVGVRSRGLEFKD